MSASREMPILMDATSIRGILDGTKTQTRRPIKPKPPPGHHWDEKAHLFVRPDSQLGIMRHHPFAPPGGILWVRETFAVLNDDELGGGNRGDYLEYRADSENPYPGDWPTEDARGNPDAPKWRPSIHMPRSACRIVLRVKRVWAERVQEISEKDALAEGVSARSVNVHADASDPWGKFYSAIAYVPSFADRWDSIYAKRGLGWDANPWVWACEFERMTE